MADGRRSQRDVSPPASPMTVAVQAGAEALDDALDLADCIGDSRQHRPRPVWDKRPDPPSDYDRWMEYAARAVIDAATETIECWRCGVGTALEIRRAIEFFRSKGVEDGEYPCPNPYCVDGRVCVLRREAAE